MNVNNTMRLSTQSHVQICNAELFFAHSGQSNIKIRLVAVIYILVPSANKAAAFLYDTQFMELFSRRR